MWLHFLKAVDLFVIFINISSFWCWVEVLWLSSLKHLTSKQILDSNLNAALESEPLLNFEYCYAKLKQ